MLDALLNCLNTVLVSKAPYDKVDREKGGLRSGLK